MKKLLFLLLLIPFLGNSQSTFTAPVGYNTGAPTATPSGVGTRWRFDLLTGKKYTWLPGTLSWDEDARGIDQVAGCSAPLYTPGYNQSTFAVNSCTPKPELYQWTGSAWAILNPETLYTEGTGIDITGGVITNTAPDQTVTMTDGTGIDVTGTYPNFTVTNTSPNVVQTLSIAGQDLTLSGGGGTVEIPVGSSDALGTGFIAGGGTGTIPDNASASWGGGIATTTWGGDGYNYTEWTSGDLYAYNQFGPDATVFTASNSVSGQSYEAVFGIAPTYLVDISTTNAGQRFRATDGSILYQVTGAGAVIIDAETKKFTLDSGGDKFEITDTGDGKGMTYKDDYSATIITNPTSITDVTSVNLLIGKKVFNANHTATGTATTAFTVTLPTTQPDATYSVSIMPKNALSATGWYISARTTTDFTVTYLTGLTGAVDFDYIIVN